jgi:hypothetical protein
MTATTAQQHTATMSMDTATMSMDIDGYSKNLYNNTGEQ